MKKIFLSKTLVIFIVFYIYFLMGKCKAWVYTNSQKRDYLGISDDTASYPQSIYWLKISGGSLSVDNEIATVSISGGAGGNIIYMEESNTPILDSSSSNMTFNFDSGFDISTVGTQGNITIDPSEVSSDLDGSWNVLDDSHAHTGASISGVDISDDTNLTAGDFITLTGDDLDVDTAAVSNGDITHVPTCDGVYDFCETTQSYYNSLADVQGACSNDFHNIGGTDDDVPESGDFGAGTDLEADGSISDNSVDGTDIALGSDASGDVMYYDGTDWTRLGADAGKYLKSGTPPIWDTPGGSGDVTGIGDCVSGDCLDGTSDGGTWIKFYDAQGAGQLITGDLSSARTWTCPDRNGTVLLSGDVLTGDVTATFDTDGSTATTVTSDITRDIEWDTEAEVETAWSGANILLETEIDASSELVAIMDDETGSGKLVFQNTAVLVNPNISTMMYVDANTLITAGGYVNWGSVKGDLGYGFDDDSGVVKAKNSGGEWNRLDEKPIIFTIDPGNAYDTDSSSTHIIKVGDSFPNGYYIYAWEASCNVDPDVEMDVNLKYADAWIGLANAQLIDVLDTTNGVSSESTPGNINSGDPVPNGKVMYLLFDADPDGTCTQLTICLWGRLP